MLLKHAWMNSIRQVLLSLGNLSLTIRRNVAAIAAREAGSVMGGRSTREIFAK
jgi:hypothetical protein